MPYEDFTTYTEVDPNNHITVASATHIDFLSYMNEDAHVYKDKGAGYFTDFIHLIDVKRISDSAVGARCFYWMLSNAVDDGYGLQTSGETFIGFRYIRSAAPTRLFHLVEAYGGTLYLSVGFTVTFGTMYYLTIQKSGTSLTCKIYSDSARTTLLATLSLTLQANHNFRYIFACNTDNTGGISYGDNDIENLDLQEVTAKGFSDVGGGSDSFLNPYRAMPFSDVGYGAEAFNTPFRAMGFADVGAGLDSYAKEILEAILKAFADAGLGSDVFSIPFKAMGFSDAGHGTDIFVALLWKAFADAVNGSEVFTKEVPEVVVGGDSSHYYYRKKKLDENTQLFSLLAELLRKMKEET